jgi:F-type H+-transporting ATPase subunit b
MMEFFHEPENWVAVCFVIFLGVLAYVGVHRKMLDALDHRSARIKAELDEARRLRDEAGKLLADYQKKQRQAEREAEAIVADAKAEAGRVAAEARVKMEEFVARRTKLAEAKIGQAEAQALADVRAAAADAAVTAAETLLRMTVKTDTTNAFIARSIRNLNLSDSVLFDHQRQG